MIDKKAKLLEWLQTALELELATIPPYLVALFSIKPTSNRAAAELIRSVVIEEMLHIALVANVINAVNGEPRIDKSAIPSFPSQMTFEGEPFADRRFQIDLAPFSEGAIETFLKIEMPHHVATDYAWLEARIDVPGLTIGDFYGKILALLEELAASGSLFTGDDARQLGQDFYWSSGGRIIRVNDLESAREALDMVVTQGEGAPPPGPAAFAARRDGGLELGHYYRFNEIAKGRYYVQGDDPSGDPTGEPIVTDYTQVLPIATNATSTDYPIGSAAAEMNEAFNRQYTLMLRQIGEAVNGNPKALYTAIMNGMHEVSSLARQLMATPIPGMTHNACPTFEWVDS